MAVALAVALTPALAAPAKGAPADPAPAHAAPGGGAPRAAVAAAPKIVWTGPGSFGIGGVAVSPDGRTVATGAFDNTVKLWNAADGSLLHTLAAHNGFVDTVAFTPDGQFVASGSDFAFGDPASNVKLWRVSDGAFVGDFAHQQGTIAFAVAVSPDGTLLAAGHQGGQINIWRIADRRLLRTIVADNGDLPQVMSLAFSPDGQFLAAGTGSHTVRIYRTTNFTLARTLTGHTGFVTGLAFSRDGTTLASAGNFDQTVRLWRAPQFTLLRTLKTADTAATVSFSSDGQALAAAGGDVITLFQPPTGTRLTTIPAPFTSAATFTGASTVVAGSFDGHVRLFASPGGALTATFGKHTAQVRTVAFSPDGALFASGSSDTTARIWRAADGKAAPALAEHTDVINSVAFGPDSSLVVTAAGAPPPDTRDTTIKVWKVGADASVRTLPGHRDGSTGAVVSGDSQTVISTGRDGTLRFWRISDGTLIRAVTDGTPSGALAISPNRKIVATGSDGSAVNLYDADTGALLRSVPAGTVTALSFSGDGTRLAVGLAAFGNNVQILDVATGTLVRTLPGDPNGFVQGVSFAPNGSFLASSSGFTHVIQLWNPDTGALVASFDQETGFGPDPQLPLAFAPSSATLGYGRTDATVVVMRTA
jgi:WD40 repeat protein